MDSTSRRWRLGALCLILSAGATCRKSEHAGSAIDAPTVSSGPNLDAGQSPAGGPADHVSADDATAADRAATHDLAAADQARVDDAPVTPPHPDAALVESHDLGGPASIWHPAPGVSWQWQLTGTIDVSVDASMFDVDLFDVPASTVADLHARGRTVICYFSAGSFEDWRPDASQFPAAVKGKPLAGWPGEFWLDVRRLDLLGPIMRARLDLCRSKGFDGVEADNVDGYSNPTGLPLTAADQLAYNRFLADEAHARGLSIGLKNDLDQIPDLLPSFDWALDEECFTYNECDLLRPFIDANKAVFNVEYTLKAADVCPKAKALRFSTLIKNTNLDARREACP